MNVEIPSKDWPRFCEMVTSLDAVLVDVRAQVPRSGEMETLAEAALLHSVTFEKRKDAHGNSITIEFSSPQSGPSQHRIGKPIHLILRNDTDGDYYHILEIPAEAGMTVIVFHPGISPMLLDDLKIPQLA